jgi:hypothetical protein
MTDHEDTFNRFDLPQDPARNHDHDTVVPGQEDDDIWHGEGTNHPLQTARGCIVHPTHTPTSHVNEVHHVWPRGHGGPNIAANRIVVCATGHNSIHQLLSFMLKAENGTVDPSVFKTYTAFEQQYAQLGYDRIKRGAM